LEGDGRIFASSEEERAHEREQCSGDREPPPSALFLRDGSAMEFESDARQCLDLLRSERAMPESSACLGIEVSSSGRHRDGGLRKQVG
jgi:hypothetical protein